MLDLLSHLVDKSLVFVAEQDDEARYRMLETVRQYGREKLEEIGEAEGTCGAGTPRGSWRWPNEAEPNSRDASRWSGWSAWRSSTTTCGRPCDSLERGEDGERRAARLGAVVLLVPARAPGRGIPLHRRGARAARCSPRRRAGQDAHAPGPSCRTGWTTSRTTKRLLEESVALFRRAGNETSSGASAGWRGRRRRCTG